MSVSVGSGLAIGGAAATVVVVGVASYFIATGNSPEKIPAVQQVQPETGTIEQPEIALIQPEPTPEPTKVIEPEVEPKAAPEPAKIVEPVVTPEPTKVPEPAQVVAPEPVKIAEPVQEVTPEPEKLAEPEPAPEPEKVAEPEPEVIATAPEIEVVDATPQPTPPSFDLVRVDKDGSAVIAGKAAPETTVIILLNGEAIHEASVDASGAFVALIDFEPSDVPRELTLVQKQDDLDDLASVGKVLVMPFKPKAVVAPKLVIAQPDSIEVIAPPKVKPVASDITTPAQTASTEDLSLDTIIYDDLGDVVISGRGNSSDFIRVYLDNKPADAQKVQDNGQWKITLTDVPDGLYDLRVDSVDATGVVTERVKSPFKREAVTDIAAVVSSDVSSVTIQPGYTLWALAETRYGNGRRYVQIYDANRDHIKNPDLIYPGQIFDLPK